MTKISKLLIAGFLVIGSTAVFAQGGGAGAGAKSPSGQSSGGKTDTAKDTLKSSKIGTGRSGLSGRRRHHARRH